MNRPAITRFTFAVLALLLVPSLAPLRAQTVTILHSFPAYCYKPGTLVQGDDGNFYGTAAEGGVAGHGAVFKVSAEGDERLLYSFGTNSGDGVVSSPNPLIEGGDGNFYGTTSGGGYYGRGMAFKITPSGKETVLYSFGAYPGDTSSPTGALAQGQNGNFYGISSLGGSLGFGTVFEITPSGSETIIHYFGSSPDDGAGGTNFISGSDGNFYFLQGAGSAAKFFRLTPAGTETVLYNFRTGNLEQASYPTSLSPTVIVQGADSNFYGIMSSDGTESPAGRFFSVTNSGAGIALYDFGSNPADGRPTSLVLGKDGNFFGTAVDPAAPDAGMIFKITPSGAETILYHSSTESPQSLVQGQDGNLYGTASANLGLNEGTFFQFTSSGTLTNLYEFGTDRHDGFAPEAPLVQGRDGAFYGTTSKGGAYGLGTVFRMTPSGAESLFYSFGANSNDGGNPGALTLGSDGNLYGVAEGGYGYSLASLFKITPSGIETNLYSFGTNPITYDNSASAVVLGGDGDIYGALNFGGNPGGGIVFKITPSGTETLLDNFTGSLGAGPYPQPTLLQGRDGNLYGTTSQGGSNNTGAIFKVTPAGAVSILYSFGTNPDDYGSPPLNGIGPNALLQGADGNFYGTTTSGIIFQITADGTETVLRGFGDSEYGGVYPEAGLILGRDGNFYGTTQYGGREFCGTIFQLTPSGTVTVLYNFGSVQNDGIFPQGKLLQGADGCFYGTTPRGGANGTGTVYKLDLGQPLARDQQVVLSNASPVTIKVLSTAYQPNGAPQTVTLVTQPFRGQATVDADGAILYTPSRSFANYGGTDTFRYAISNGSATATATVRISNPFYRQKGTFVGTPSFDAGFPTAVLNLTLTGSGSFTGLLKYADSPGAAFHLYPIKGSFGPDGIYNDKVGGGYLILNLDVSNSGVSNVGSYTLNGNYGGQTLFALHSAARPGLLAGYYTVLLYDPPVSDYATGQPDFLGTGYATVTVSGSGLVAIAGALPTGQTLSAGTLLTGSGEGAVEEALIIFNRPHSSQPLLTGSLVFTNFPGVSDCSGGFTGGLSAIPDWGYISAVGSRYSPPPPRELALDLPSTRPNATITFSTNSYTNGKSGSLSEDVTASIGANGTDNVTGSAGLKMTINTKNGLFRGSFIDPISKQRAPFQGALLTKQNIANGFIRTPKRFGAVSLISK